jgi:rod shape-determining protein MreC
LQREIVQLRAQVTMSRLSKSEYAQLQRLLQLAGRGGYRVVAARVVAAGPAYENTVTIDAGSADGIKPEETVLNGDGLVGTVTSVSIHTSTVLLDTDASSTVGVRVAGTGQIGAVTGTGRSQSGPAALRLQVFDANAVLRPGEQLVTFGSRNGRPYVPGVPVGVITRVRASASALTKIAYVRPYADNGALGVVGVVIVPPRTNPRFSVLPPSPAPSPTPTPTASPSLSATPTASPTWTGG